MRTQLQERVRTTTATERRTENLKKIINRLILGELPRHEMATLLGYSPSAVRKYATDLIEANVMFISYREPSQPWRHNMDHSEGAPVYALNPDTEVIDNFLAILDRDPLRAKQFISVAIVDPDAPKQKSTNVWRSKPVKHEPVLAHFFGLVSA